jgi:hypothetical protein
LARGSFMPICSRPWRKPQTLVATFGAEQQLLA